MSHLSPPPQHIKAMNCPNPGFERAIVNILKGLAEYAYIHLCDIEYPIADDWYLGEFWNNLFQSAVGLLNGETGRLDCATIDYHMRVLQNGGPDIEKSLEAFGVNVKKSYLNAKHYSNKPKSKQSPSDIPKRKLSDRQIELLSKFEVKDQIATYADTDRISDWTDIKSVMMTLGGKWSSQRGGFVFPSDADPYGIIQLAKQTGEIIDPKLVGFFPTPKELAEQVVSIADIKPGMRVLEPSAGIGAIADIAKGHLKNSGELICVEIIPDNATTLRGRDHITYEEDFLSLDRQSLGEFDRIVMNPPFSNQADIHHIRHAFSLLKPGGKLVSIASASIKYRDNRLTREFRKEIEDANGAIFDNPENSFLVSGTKVDTVIIIMDKNEK